ncbi:hypothetical protein J4453_02365 [Candidatus Woesearchaeota archaeon]|nr:hypothetical protein [Candidatus Woesearchaeota archaeon]
MAIKTALDRFNTMDLRDYAGMAVGIIDGKIAFKDKNPRKVMKRLLDQQEDKEVALICVPKVKMAMSL